MITKHYALGMSGMAICRAVSSHLHRHGGAQATEGQYSEHPAGTGAGHEACAGGSLCAGWAVCGTDAVGRQCGLSDVGEGHSPLQRDDSGHSPKRSRNRADCGATKEEEIRMIWATGDCHGNFERFKPEYFPEQAEMTKEDTIIIKR